MSYSGQGNKEMLYKRGSIYHVKFKAGGHTYQKSTRTSVLKKAQEFERALRAEVAEHLHAQRIGIPVVRTFGEARKKWMDSGAPESMRSHSDNAGLYLDDIALHLVVPAAHQMKANMLKRGLSPQTINRRLAVVRRILNVAYREWDWLREPLGKKIVLLSEKGFEREVYLSMEEVDQVLRAVKSDVARTVIIFAAYTGLRRGEILRLTPKEWHPPYLILKNKTKGKKPRSIPIIEWLQPYMTLPFKLSFSQLRSEFENARERIQRPDIRFHDLRHTFASWLAKDPNVPAAMIRDILGHSSLAVTNRYMHLRGNSLGVVSAALSGPGVEKGVEAEND